MIVISLQKIHTLKITQIGWEVFKKLENSVRWRLWHNFVLTKIFTLFTQFRKEVNTQYGLLHVLQSYSEPANKILFSTFFSGDDNGQKPHGSDAVFMHRIVVQLQLSSWILANPFQSNVHHYVIFKLIFASFAA